VPGEVKGQRDNLPAPDILAAEIGDDLEAALAELAQILLSPAAEMNVTTWFRN
jgi:hypothetical protein